MDRSPWTSSASTASAVQTWLRVSPPVTNSEPGRGTTFKVYFPRTAETLPASHKVQKQIQGGSETILLVEDEVALRELTCLLLQEAGYAVLESSGVEDAIAIAKDSHRKIDLLLTDIVMPRLDGRELANQLVALRPNLKILYMSGYSRNSVVHNGKVFEDVMARAQLTHHELQAALRQAGYSCVEEVGTAVLENNGTISVVRRTVEHKQDARMS